MDNDLKKLRLGLNDRTSLLESLGWDDEELTRLERYFQIWVDPNGFLANLSNYVFLVVIFKITKIDFRYFYNKQN